jgi:5-methyltetrahydropteroyltriglutamate--homocysteine methyltransferase
MIATKRDGGSVDEAAFAKRVREAVDEGVRHQAAAGIDIVSDGEMGKSSFVHYVRDRIAGFEGVETVPVTPQRTMAEDFPGYTEWRNRGRGGGSPFNTRPLCIGPLSWKDLDAVKTDIANFKAALGNVSVQEAFVPCASVGIIAQRLSNKYYPAYEQYVQAIAEVMREEYHLVAESGLIVQIDAPEMCIDRNLPEFRDRPMSDFNLRQSLWVEALNFALEGIPEEQVRYHVCWGNQEAPHSRDVALKDIVHIVLKVKAQAYSVEASNPRHAHEWKLWQDVKLPEGKLLIPGVIDSVTNFVEHPELVADRILTYANIVGRENVIAGTDCGFGTSAGTENVYPPVVWAKLATLAEGAKLASAQLWG